MIASSLRGLSVLALVVATPAWAQDDEAPPAPPPTDTGSNATITVLATGSRLPINEVGQSISVIGEDEITSIQGPDFTRVVTRLPGVSVARNGGLGNTTSLFVRGADSQQLLVMIDGVRVADTSAPSGGYDFGGLLSGGLGKVELLRGSNSVVWGSDAIGGVMSITSRELNGYNASVEYGSHNSWDGEASLGVQRDTYALSVDGGYATTDGIPTLATDTSPAGFHQWHLAARGRLQLADGLNFVATGRYASSRLAVDSYDEDGNLVAIGEYQTSKQASGRAGLEYTTGALSLSGGLAQSNIDRTYVQPWVSDAPYGTFLGTSTRADLTGHLALPLFMALDFGADSEWTKARSYYSLDGYTSTFHGTANLSSGHALLGWYSDRLTLAAGVRVDDQSAFGSHWSFGANGAFRLIDDVRFKASYGDGFKAPTLYQLYAPDYGNRALKAENSHSYDLGLEKGERSGKLHAGITWFHRVTNNLIDFATTEASPDGGYYNVGRARAQGWEVELDARPVEQLALHAAYTYTKSINETLDDGDLGKDLARRPRQLLTVAGDWTPAIRGRLSGLSLGADVRLAGASYDDAANTVRLASYAVVGVRASVPLTRHVELFGRIENIGDAHYETAAGYNTYGRTAFIGVRAKG